MLCRKLETFKQKLPLANTLLISATSNKDVQVDRLCSDSEVSLNYESALKYVHYYGFCIHFNQSVARGVVISQVFPLY